MSYATFFRSRMFMLHWNMYQDKLISALLQTTA